MNAGGIRNFNPVPARTKVIAPAEMPSWRIERSGNFGGYVVSGWRYTDLAIWHVKLWSKNESNPQQTYIVAAGELYPDTILPAERFAVLRLIAMWEAVSISR